MAAKPNQVNTPKLSILDSININNNSGYNTCNDDDDDDDDVLKNKLNKLGLMELKNDDEYKVISTKKRLVTIKIIEIQLTNGNKIEMEIWDNNKNVILN